MKDDLKERIANWLSDWKQRRDDCGDDHTDVVWYRYTPMLGLRGRSNLEVRGHCSYCFTGLTRPLNENERAIFDSFRQSMYKPVTR